MGVGSKIYKGLLIAGACLYTGDAYGWGRGCTPSAKLRSDGTRAVGARLVGTYWARFVSENSKAGNGRGFHYSNNNEKVRIRDKIEYNLIICRRCQLHTAAITFLGCHLIVFFIIC